MEIPHYTVYTSNDTSHSLSADTFRLRQLDALLRAVPEALQPQPLSLFF